MTANPNAPFGLRPVRHMFGGVVRPNEYNIADQYGTAMYLGDPVLVTGTGMNIGIASAGTSNKMTGIFAGCEWVDSVGNTQWSKYWPASTVTNTAYPIKAWVYDDPFLLYEVQFTALVAADIRALANLTSGSGTTQTGQSGWYATEPPGSGENQVKIYNLSNCVNPGSVPNAYGSYAVGLVMLSQHELAGAMTNE